MLKDDRYLTTGEVARLCSVTRDAVLKWINTGRLPARRTAGGHHRVDPKDVELMRRALKENRQERVGDKSHLYCWEYYGKDEIQAECLSCAVYLLRAMRCYELERVGVARELFKCLVETDCLECSYYQEVHGDELNVLVVTGDQALGESLAIEARERGLNLKVADCEYDCSALVGEFKPDYAIIDRDCGISKCNEIVGHLGRDSRIPFLRIVVAADRKELSAECRKGIYAWLEKPFGIDEILECLHRTAE